MEDQTPDHNHNPSQGSERSEPVRSRWTPKPEQILILESIFNSGMVNPPKDETVRIRKLLEKYGSVGDANVFYWFQNRRSRSRRRQRQLQAGLVNDQRIPIQGGGGSGSTIGGAIQYDHFQNNASFAPPPPPCLVGSSSSTSSSSCGIGGGGGGGVGDDVVEDLFSSMSNQMGFPDVVDHHHNTSLNQSLCLDDHSNLHYQSGFITVFINGVPTEVLRGPIDMKAMFGQNMILFHSSGVPVPINEYGISLQSLQLGESYFLVSGPT